LKKDNFKKSITTFVVDFFMGAIIVPFFVQQQYPPSAVVQPPHTLAHAALQLLLPVGQPFSLFALLNIHSQKHYNK